MEYWEDNVECCLTLGTSLCGMRSDSMWCEAASRNINGLIIVWLQPTAKDYDCGVRLWGSSLAFKFRV
jgi:hypothetical protein